MQGVVRRAPWHRLTDSLPMLPGRVGRTPTEEALLPGVAGRSSMRGLGCLAPWIPLLLETIAPPTPRDAMPPPPASARSRRRTLRRPDGARRQRTMRRWVRQPGRTVREDRLSARTPRA